MELVLVRHEAAEDADGHITDAERRLTKEGREDAKKSAKGLRHLLYDYDKICVLSSPLVRAVQTAEDIAKALKVREVQKVTGIASGLLELLQEELVELDEETCVIVVGHEPDMSNWCQRICNVKLNSRKGAAACIKLQSIDPAIMGKLSWFAEPDVLKALGKFSQADLKKFE